MLGAGVALRVLGLQLSATPAPVADNLRNAEALIRANPGWDLYVLPELSSCGYSDAVLARVDEVAEDAYDGVSCAFFGALAQELSVHIAYGFARRRSPTEPAYADGRFAISHAVMGPDGTLAIVYDKMHVCSMGLCSEAAYGFSSGDRMGFFECEGNDGHPVRVGLSICYDLRFPELYRNLAWNHDCDIVLHPSAFIRDATFPTYHQFAITRAQENGCYLLSVNYAGEEFGESVAVPPWIGPIPTREGEVELRTSSLGTSQAVLPQVVRRDHLAAVRAAFPYRQNINPALSHTHYDGQSELH